MLYKKMRDKVLIIRSLIFILGLSLMPESEISAQKIKGITMVAPPRAFNSNPMEPLKTIACNYIKVVPYGFTMKGETGLHYNTSRQWWGEKKEGVEETIAKAKEAGIGVMLKPQVYMPRGWVGELDFESEAEWLEWEANYRKFIFDFLDIAIEHEVEIFCVGTEFKISVQKRTAFWNKLIEDMRDEYCGLLTYSANWDCYEKISFWDRLDFIGVSSYFPLSEAETPQVSKLVKAWKPIVNSLGDFSDKIGRPILFTEYGYLSVDACASKTWELEKKVKKLDINQEAQANAFEALYQVFWKEDFWAGGFIWKWFPEGMGHEGYPERDYTPQGKKSLETISNWFHKNVE